MKTANIRLAAAFDEARHRLSVAAKTAAKTRVGGLGGKLSAPRVCLGGLGALAVGFEYVARGPADLGPDQDGERGPVHPHHDGGEARRGAESRGELGDLE